MEPLFRIHLVYIADGMRRPLSSRQDVRADRAFEAVRTAEANLSSAYVSGYETISWTAENLNMRPAPTTGETVSERAAAATLEALARYKEARREVKS